MAVSTERKRRSVNQLPPLTVLPPPDGSIDSQDRMIVSWLYGGIAPGTITLMSAESIAFDLYIDQARAVTLSIDQGKEVDLFIDKGREFTLER